MNLNDWFCNNSVLNSDKSLPCTAFAHPEAALSVTVQTGIPKLQPRDRTVDDDDAAACEHLWVALFWSPFSPLHHEYQFSCEKLRQSFAYARNGQTNPKFQNKSQKYGQNFMKINCRVSSMIHYAVTVIFYNHRNTTIQKDIWIE